MTVSCNFNHIAIPIFLMLLLSCLTLFSCSRQDILNTSRKQFKGTGENSTAVVNSAVVVQPKPQQKKQDGDLWITPLPYTLHHNSSRREKMLEFDKV